MALEQQIAALATEANALTTEVTGKMAAIDAKVAAKELEVDNYLATADTKYISHIGFPIDLTQGDPNTYYPVILPNSRMSGIHSVNISRGYYHQDGLNLGGCELRVEYRLDHWPNNGDLYKATLYKDSIHQLCGGIERAGVAGVAVFLLGGRTYTVRSNVPAVVTQLSVDALPAAKVLVSSLNAILSYDHQPTITPLLSAPVVTV